MEKEWVIIFLIYANFRDEETGRLNTELQREYESLKKDLKTCNLQDEMKIVVIQNVITPNKIRKAITSDKTTVSFLKKVGCNKNRLIKIETVFTDDPLQKKNDLGSIFKKIDNNLYTQAGITKGKRYCLVTWDHGSAFGIFKKIEPVPTTTEMITAQYQNVSVTLKNNTCSSSRLLINQGGFNRIKKEDGGYELLPRATGVGPTHFFDTSRELLFTINPKDELHQFAAALLSDPIISPDLKLEVSDKSLQISSDQDQSDSFFATVKASSCWPLAEKSEFLQKSFLANRIDLMDFTPQAAETKMVDILTNEELDEAIEIGLGPGRKIDVLLMMNCYMMNVMACYALQHRVKYLVAPQGTISEPGYNYIAILQQISQSIFDNSIIEADELAKLYVHSCGYESDMRRRRFKEKIDQWDVMAISLKNYTAIVDAIDTVAQICIKVFKMNNGIDPGFTFSHVRNLCRIFNDMELSYNMIDIGYWLTELIIKLEEININTTELLKQHLIINSFTNKYFLAKRNSNWIDINIYQLRQLLQRQATGICLYFPTIILTNDDVHTIFIDGGSSSQARFIKEKKNWLKFLSKDFS